MHQDLKFVVNTPKKINGTRASLEISWLQPTSEGLIEVTKVIYGMSTQHCLDMAMAMKQHYFKNGLLSIRDSVIVE